MGRPTTSQERVDALGFKERPDHIEWVEACPGCGSKRFDLLTEFDRYGFSFPTAFCRQCGLGFLHKRLTSEGYADFYLKWYRPLVSSYSGRQQDETSIQAEQQRYAKRMADLSEGFIRGQNCKSMFDIGGSTGIVAKIFRDRFGLEVTVLDPAPLETAVADSMGIRSVTCLFEDFETDEKWDVAACFRTIDHFMDPLACLKKMHRLLNDGGLLLVDIVDFLASAKLTGSLEQATKLDHPFSFSALTFEPLLARCGFEVQRICLGRYSRVPYFICRKVEAPFEMPCTEVDRLYWELTSIPAKAKKKN
mgnify:FL=1